MTQHYQFHDIARLPLPGDNVAIVTRRLAAGTQIDYQGQSFQLSHTLLEGHRFAVHPIAAGEALLSWELPFGYALREIAAGEYVCNAGMIESLSLRNLDFSLPEQPNFREQIVPFQLDEAACIPVEQLARHTQDRTFLGYRRSDGRGVGTRNVIVLLGTSSRTAGFVRQIEGKLKGLASNYPNMDGIVAIAHTEGDTPNPNNTELILHTLAGFMVNANVGAVLVVDYGNEPINNAMLQAYLKEKNYPISELPHEFISISGNWIVEMARAETIVRGWLDKVNSTPRTPESLAHIKLALQCGGSDAFSGISANPLLAWMAREVVRYGGVVNLAETDELVGAEHYVLAKVKDVATARKFLAAVESFKQRVGWHGASAAGNPSGGNKYRGLYNIILKSIGAAMKKHPDLRLDHVINYADRMLEPGFYFMDSPGNDLEGIAGQVAAGATMIIFTTGNGSITNFPYVPTIKVVTTTTRFQLLEKDMDLNAGSYLEGVPMDELGAQAVDYLVEVASGKLSVGERAGHSQVQLWRNWQQTGAQKPEDVAVVLELDGVPLRIRSVQAGGNGQPFTFPVVHTQRGDVSDQVALIMPTSLCASQIAQMAARRLNQVGLGRDHGISRFVALAHTEGCGASSSPERLYPRTVMGYLNHPLVNQALLLEHGCEITHNDFMKEELRKGGQELNQFGWASIQLDGGIEKVLGKIETWFTDRFAQTPAPQTSQGGLGQLRIGLTASGPIHADAAAALAQIAQVVTAAGGTVIVPENADLWKAEDFVADLGLSEREPTLAFAQPVDQAGFHIMMTPTQHWVETLVGLAASGVELIIGYVGHQPLPGHPLVPLVQVSAEPGVVSKFGEDVDLLWQGEAAGWAQAALETVARVLNHEQVAAVNRQGNVDFQVTRGLLGVSL